MGSILGFERCKEPLVRKQNICADLAFLQHVNSPGNREQFEETFAALEAAGAELYNITVGN